MWGDACVVGFSSIWRYTRCALGTGDQTCALPILCRASSGNSDAFWSAVDRLKPNDFWRGPRDGCQDWRSVVRNIALPPRAIRPRGMDAGRMKPAGARQFEAARHLPCREASDTKVFAKALLAEHHARDAKFSDVTFADATWSIGRAACREKWYKCVESS